MKRVVRLGSFETNSSSTHSLSIVTKEEYAAWENGELFFSNDEERLITESEVKELYEKELKEEPDTDFEEFREDNFQTYDEYWDEEYLEIFTQEHKTKSGDEIVVFGKYGQDG